MNLLRLFDRASDQHQVSLRSSNSKALSTKTSAGNNWLLFGPLRPNSLLTLQLAPIEPPDLDMSRANSNKLI